MSLCPLWPQAEIVDGWRWKIAPFERETSWVSKFPRDKKISMAWIFTEPQPTNQRSRCAAMSNRIRWFGEKFKFSYIHRNYANPVRIIFTRYKASHRRITTTKTNKNKSKSKSKKKKKQKQPSNGNGKMVRVWNPPEICEQISTTFRFVTSCSSCCGFRSFEVPQL